MSTSIYLQYENREAWENCSPCSAEKRVYDSRGNLTHCEPLSLADALKVEGDGFEVDDEEPPYTVIRVREA